MISIVRTKQLVLLCALLILSIVLTACAGSSTQATDEAPPEAEQAAETADQEEPAADAETEVPEEETTEVVESSQASRATELEGGTTFVSEEDVTTARTNPGGEMTGVATSDAVSFHPYITTDTASSGYQGLVYAGGLLRLDENTLEYIPHMAESYTISEDGLTFTFNLRQTIQWSDETPLTAQDFKWTYDQVTNPDNAFPYLSQLSFITSFEALDDYTLEIKIDEVYAPALGQMSGLITPLPRHIWQELDWDDPETNPEINSPTIVSGPYKLAEWERDQFVIFEANDSYWYKGRPNIDRSITEIVPDQDIAYQRLITGESDGGPITPENLEEARSLDNITVYEWWPAAAVWSYIGLNMREGYVTSDINVRKGLSHAIDKQLLTDEVMLGQGKRLCSVFPETSWAYADDVECYAYDIDKALAHFEIAGYSFDGEQMLDENGEQLTLRLLYGPNTSTTRELIAVTIQDFLGQIGINVEIQALEWASFLEATAVDEPEWDMFIGAWRATIEPHIMFTIWAEDSIPDLNAVAYINKDVEGIFEEAGKTYDVEFRRGKYQEVQRIISDEAPYIFLFYNKSWSGRNNRIQGIQPTPLGIGWNRADWFIKETGE